MAIAKRRAIDALRRKARHDAGPACHVQHTFSRRKVSDLHQQRRPRPEDVASDMAFVHFGGCRSDMPLLGLVHLKPHLSLRDIRSAV